MPGLCFHKPAGPINGSPLVQQKGMRMILIDYRDTRPIYEQVVERFKMLILHGVLTSDEKIPSVRNLAVELSINPNTIQRAYAELDSGQLLLKYKEEVFAEILKICKAAFEIGITEEELIEAIRGGKTYD